MKNKKIILILSISLLLTSCQSKSDDVNKTETENPISTVSTETNGNNDGDAKEANVDLKNESSYLKINLKTDNKDFSKTLQKKEKYTPEELLKFLSEKYDIKPSLYESIENSHKDVYAFKHKDAPENYPPTFEINIFSGNINFLTNNNYQIVGNIFSNDAPLEKSNVEYYILKNYCDKEVKTVFVDDMVIGLYTDDGKNDKTFWKYLLINNFTREVYDYHSKALIGKLEDSNQPKFTKASLIKEHNKYLKTYDIKSYEEFIQSVFYFSRMEKHSYYCKGIDLNNDYVFSQKNVSNKSTSYTVNLNTGNIYRNSTKRNYGNIYHDNDPLTREYLKKILHQFFDDFDKSISKISYNEGNMIFSIKTLGPNNEMLDITNYEVNPYTFILSNNKTTEVINLKEIDFKEPVSITTDTFTHGSYSSTELLKMLSKKLSIEEMNYKYNKITFDGGYEFISLYVDENNQPSCRYTVYPSTGAITSDTSDRKPIANLYTNHDATDNFSIIKLIDKNFCSGDLTSSIIGYEAGQPIVLLYKTNDDYYIQKYKYLTINPYDDEVYDYGTDEMLGHLSYEQERVFDVKSLEEAQLKLLNKNNFESIEMLKKAVFNKLDANMTDYYFSGIDQYNNFEFSNINKTENNTSQKKYVVNLSNGNIYDGSTQKNISNLYTHSLPVMTSKNMLTNLSQKYGDSFVISEVSSIAGNNIFALQDYSRKDDYSLIKYIEVNPYTLNMKVLNSDAYLGNLNDMDAYINNIVENLPVHTNIRHIEDILAVLCNHQNLNIMDYLFNGLDIHNNFIFINTSSYQSNNSNFIVSMTSGNVYTLENQESITNILYDNYFDNTYIEIYVELNHRFDNEKAVFGRYESGNCIIDMVSVIDGNKIRQYEVNPYSGEIFDYETKKSIGFVE